jgi:hypothetical protein
MYRNIFQYKWFIEYVKISANLVFKNIKSYKNLK